MKNLKVFLLTGLIACMAFGDTPPPGTVKSKTFTGDGLTGITATGTSLNVNVTGGGGGGGTVDQGNAGSQSWLVDVTNTVPVTGTFFQATQPVSGPLTDTQLRATAVPISASSLPLPTGASTSALQTSGNTSLSSIDTKTPALGQALAAGSIPVVLTASQLTTLTPPSTVAVTQGTSPWVTSGTSTVSGTVAATQSGTWTTGRTWNLTSGSDSVASVQSGTWNINNISGTVSLPTGAATEVTLAKLPLSQGSTTSGQSGPLVQGAVTTAAPSYSTTQTSPLSLTTAGALRTDSSATTQPISAASLPLPTGAATSALQTSGNSSLSSIDTKTPALGQALAASSVPVVLTASQLTTLTPLSTVAVTQSTSPWVISGSTTVSGTVAATQSGTWNLNNITGTVSLPTGASTETTLAKLTQTQGSTTSGQAGPLVLGAVTTAAPAYSTAQSSPLSLTTAGAMRVDGSGSTQPISGTVAATQSGTWNITNVSGTVSLPTGASTSALQTTGNTSLSSIDTKTPALGQALAAASVPVVLTAAQLTTLTPLSTVAVTQSTSPWVSNTSQINGVTPLMGNGVTGTGSQRVTIASDNTAFSVNAAQSGTWNINNISGTVSLPTGAATAANQLLAPKSVTGTQVTGTVSTVITLTAPANTVGYILQATDSNTANMRYRVGATATTTSGMQLQPGRDTGFVPLGANISIVAESGTQEYEVQWVSQ